MSSDVHVLKYVMYSVGGIFLHLSFPKQKTPISNDQLITLKSEVRKSQSEQTHEAPGCVDSAGIQIKRVQKNSAECRKSRV